MRIKLLGMVIAAVFLLSGSARADLVLQFGQSGVSGLTNFTATAGSSVAIEVYLTQSGLYDPFGTGDPADFVTDNRLTGAGNSRGLGGWLIDVGIAGDGAVSHADAATFVFGANFDNLPGASVNGSVLNAGAFATADPVDPNRVLPVKAPVILLGTMTLDVSSLATGSYSLTTDFTNGISLSLGTNPLNTVDPTEPANFVFGGSGTLDIISAVPEPSSMAVLGLMGAAGFARSVRNRRKAAKV